MTLANPSLYFLLRPGSHSTSGSFLGARNITSCTVTLIIDTSSAPLTLKRDRSLAFKECACGPGFRFVRKWSCVTPDGITLHGQPQRLKPSRLQKATILPNHPI